MRVALESMPQDREYQPEGISTVRIDRKTGKLASPGSDNAYFEFFRDEQVPTDYADKTLIEQPRVTQKEAVIVRDGTKPESSSTTTNQAGGSTQRETQPRSSQRKKIEQLF